MMLLDLFGSRLQFPGMAFGFVKRMLDEAIATAKRMVSGKICFRTIRYNNILRALRAVFYDYFSALSINEWADIKMICNLWLEANTSKTISTDLMGICSDFGATGGCEAYKLNHIGGKLWTVVRFRFSKVPTIFFTTRLPKPLWNKWKQ